MCEPDAPEQSSLSIQDRARSALSVNDFDKALLVKFVEAHLDGRGCGECYDMHSDGDVKSIYKLKRLGYLTTFDADDGPYMVFVTEAGVEAVASRSIGQPEGRRGEDQVTEINIVGNNGSVLIQKDTIGSSQAVELHQYDLDELAKKIIALSNDETFLTTFGENAALVQTQAKAALEAKDRGLKKTLLGIVRDIAVKVGVSLGTEGVLGVFGSLIGAL